MTFKKSTKRSLTSEMDRNVRQMLKLIEEDGDSFAQKAEMYYQKRPELISLVEDVYRGYRTLAERYEHVTGELWKNIPSDLQSQASGASDNGSEPPSIWPSPSPRKLGRRISGNRAAGFDFFLGSGGNGYDACQKDGDGSSTLTDSDEEFDDASSINSYSGFFGNAIGDHSMNRRMMEMELELREVKEKLCMYEEARLEEGSSSRGARMIERAEGVAKINAYERELRTVNEKLRLSHEEITRLTIELEKFKSMESAYLHDGVELSSTEEALDLKTLGEELRITKEKLVSSEMQIASLNFEASKSSESIQQLQDQLSLAHKDIANWKTKLNSEKRESTRLQERLARLKFSLADRDHEIRDLKAALCDAEQKIFFEKAHLKSEISKLLGQQTHLEEEIRKIQTEKLEIEETLKGEIELLKEDTKGRKNNAKDLNVNLDALKLERDNLNAEVGSLKEEINSRDNQIEHLNRHLNQLHMEHMQLSAGMEEAHRHVGELKSRAKQLEEEIERQKIEILEGAEEKREAIRQLCFSLEHYRNGYNVLRQAFIGNRRFPVLAA